MLLPVKINKKYLNEGIASAMLRFHDQSWSTADYIARQSLYLDKMDDYYSYMSKAAEWIDNLINNILKDETKRGFKKDISNAYHLKANYLRLLARENEAVKYYRIAKEYYEKVLPVDFKIDMNSVTEIRTLNAYIEVLFFLKDFDECVRLGNRLGKQEFLASKVARAIINGSNPEMLEEVANLVVRQQRTVHIGAESAVTTSQWDWYEICLQLLGLPSKLDEIEAYKEQHGL